MVVWRSTTQHCTSLLANTHTSHQEVGLSVSSYRVGTGIATLVPCISCLFLWCHSHLFIVNTEHFLSFLSFLCLFIPSSLSSNAHLPSIPVLSVFTCSSALYHCVVPSFQSSLFTCSPALYHCPPFTLICPPLLCALPLLQYHLLFSPSLCPYNSPNSPPILFHLSSLVCSGCKGR